MPATTPTRRRWYQFGIRALLLTVTVVAVWLGWELKFVRERLELKRELLAIPGLKMHSEEVWVSPGRAATPVSLPFWRRWMGDEAVAQIVPESGVLPSELERIERLFPEADLLITIRCDIEEH